MTATGHAVIGTVIAAKIGNPALAIPIALASHVIADLFPHWDTGVNRHMKSKERFFMETALDVLTGALLSLFLLFFLFPQVSITYAFIVIVAASLPDILTAPYLFFDMKYPPFSWAYRAQKSFDNGGNTNFGKYGQIWVLILLVAAAKLF